MAYLNNSQQNVDQTAKQTPVIQQKVQARRAVTIQQWLDTQDPSNQLQDFLDSV